ncbi:hypothetical protein BG015_003610 [Linnemannia schmuckeri]|uniref:Uncharacterized protein n=1 Tax=Linnemannia schmuckeri TaxID=64567 RepID=A0A9P5V3I0_9FUNG|nr:hypothetical protein BG015_003610 [Linnemannia schmuckeri]
MHHIHRQLQLEKELQHHRQDQQAGGAHTGRSRDTPYRRDSHMEHYMSDILATPAPAALLEEEGDDTLMTESHAISMKDLNERLEEIKHLHNALQAQSNSWGDRRSSSESTHHQGHQRHHHHHHHHKSHKHQHHLSEPAPVPGTPIFPASRSPRSSRSSSPIPSSFAYSDSHRQSRSPSRGISPQRPYYPQSSYSRPHSRSPSPQPMASPSPAYQFPTRPHSRSPSPQPSSGGIYHHSNGSISSVRTFSPPTTRPRTPQEALLQGLLDRLDQHYSERDQDRLRELELENEMLRRHQLHRINPDLLVKNRDHVHALSQNHGNANLRHS